VTRLGFAHAVLDALGRPWEELYSSAIDYQRPSAGGQFRSVPAEAVATQAETLRDKIVMVGTELDYRDRFRTPMVAVLGPAKGSLWHLEVQAQSVAQLLDQRWRWTLGASASLILALFSAA